MTMASPAIIAWSLEPITRSPVMMRGGRVGPGGDDREGGLVVPLVHEPIADLVSDVSLAASAKAPRGDGLHDPVGGRSGRPQALDLVGVLDRPQLGHGLGRQPERGVGQARLEPERVDRPEVVREQEPPSAPRCECRGDQLGRVVRLVPGRDLDQAIGARRRCRCRHALEARHDERGRTLRRQDQHRQTLEGHGGIAGQPAELRPDADEERLRTSIPRRFPSCDHPLRKSSRRDGAGATRGHRTAPRAACIQVAITAGPSSCSLR